MFQEQFWIQITILLIIISIVTFAVEPFQSYSPVWDDISIGNPVSWSHNNRPIIGLKRPVMNGVDFPPVIYGHGVPLATEYRSQPRGDPNLFAMRRYVSSPLCCPSKFSTDKGCVCY